MAPMGKGDKDKAEKVGDFLFRYMRARHRFKERVERPLPSNELATLIGLGKQEFDEIYIEPGANPPIVLDGKAGDVFDALINKNYRAIPFFDPQLVAAWRNYVVNDGPMPRKPGHRQAHAARDGQLTPHDHAEPQPVQARHAVPTAAAERRTEPAISEAERRPAALAQHEPA